MNAKENYLNFLRHLPSERIPVEGDCLIYGGFEFNQMEKGDRKTGLDGFGVRWVRPESGGDTSLPAPGEFLLDSDTICDWESIIQIPDAGKYHWEEDAKAQLDGVDRNEIIVDFGDGNGPFERLAALMGFEEALIAIAMEPEAVESLIDAITDYKLKGLEYIAKYYKPDTYTLYDDVATQRSPFMSPEAYRKLFKPSHQKIANRARELGMIPIIHCCGYAQDLAEDFMEEGFVAWASVQPCNDIGAVLEKLGDRFCLCGGYDTNGKPGATNDPEIIRKEVERCFEAYGKYPGYVFAGFILGKPADGESVDVGAASEALINIAVDCANHYKK